MNVTSLKFFGKCKDGSEAESYTYWEGLPPLPPGHTPAKDQVQPKQIVTPATMTEFHRVYTVEGEDVMPNETAAFWLVSAGMPVCWMAQSGMFLQGRKAIKRVFGDLYDWERFNAFDATIDVVNGVLARNKSTTAKYLFAVDNGEGWHVEASNDIDAMDKMREALASQ